MAVADVAAGPGGDAPLDLDPRTHERRVIPITVRDPGPGAR